MSRPSRSKQDKIDHPAAHYEKPDDITRDESLTEEEKTKALSTWEQDAHQLITASNEGMAGSAEGTDPADHHRLGEVGRAKAEIGHKPKQKQSQ